MVKYSPLVIVIVIARIKVKSSAGLSLDANPSSDLGPCELWPLASELPR